MFEGLTRVAAAEVSASHVLQEGDVVELQLVCALLAAALRSFETALREFDLAREVPANTPQTNEVIAETRVPPHDLDAEAAFLGCAFVKVSTAFEAARSVGLGRGDFYRQAHGLIFEAMSALYDRADPVEPLTVADELAGEVSKADLIALLTMRRRPARRPGTPRSSRTRPCAARCSGSSRPSTRGRPMATSKRAFPEALEGLTAIYDQADHEGQLLIEDIASVAAEVDASSNVCWLARPVWPGDAYGVMAAEKKTGKTWAGLDLVVSVACGGLWLGEYAVERQGPVLVFLGEGGRRKMVRRLRAICEAKGVWLEGLPIRLCHSAPTLTSSAHLAQLRQEVRRYKPVLVVVDPLYLAAAGAKSADLYSMGQVLTGIQVVCQEAGAALVLVTHFNKTGEGHGSHRMTGAGPAEWGRVLVSMSLEHRATGPDQSTTATLHVTFEGDEIPETELRLRRRVWA